MVKIEGEAGGVLTTLNCESSGSFATVEPDSKGEAVVTTVSAAESPIHA